MLRVGGPYRCGIMIEHNWQRRSGFGSCIFLHVWCSARRGTVGCTAMSPAHLKQVLHWIDARKNPIIVQLPVQEYLRLQESWHLPFRADKAEPSKCSRPLQRAEGAKYESLGRSQAQP
jgi:D-alanyl-D-alanine dipeptidase